MVRQVVMVVWWLLATVWPVARWVLALNVVYQVTQGWVWLVHFAALVAVTYFVEVYRPANFSR